MTKELLKKMSSNIKTNNLLDKMKSALIKPDAQQVLEAEVSSFELIEIRQGKFPVVIIINGFLSENSQDVTDWLSVVDEIYPENKVVQVKWKAGNIKDMVLDKGILPDVDSFAFGALAKANMVGKMSVLGVQAINKTVGHWKAKFYETESVGVNLAKVINTDQNYHSCILMGHSLGGRIIKHTLDNLDANLVSQAYLFAAAVSNDSSMWQEILNKHSNTALINCFSNKDVVLKVAYKFGTLWDHEPAGLQPLALEHSKVINLNVSEYVNGHMNFKKKDLGCYLLNQLFKNNKIETVNNNIDRCS